MTMTRELHRILFFLTVLGTPIVTANRAYSAELLYEFDWFMAGGHQPCNLGPVEFFLGYQTEPFDPIVVGLGLQSWDSGESGSIEISALNDAGFGGLASALTDGVDNYLYLLDSPSGCPGLGGNFALESFWIQGSPDLVGNNIEFIRLIVHEVIIEEQGTGVTWQSNLTYEFWGAPIPEPAPLALLVVFGAFGQRRRRSLRRESTH